jgi:SOS-response transcriptional repressor LexA
MRLHLTREPEALAFIRSFIEGHGYSPTVRELGKGLGIKGEGMPHRLIENLEADGHIVRIPRKPRGIRLANPLFRFTADELEAELLRRRGVAT